MASTCTSSATSSTPTRRRSRRSCGTAPAPPRSRARDRRTPGGAYGIVLDAEAIIAPARRPVDSVGRPWIARALVARGHVVDTGEAFDHWLGDGRPAFVPGWVRGPIEVFAQDPRSGRHCVARAPGLVEHDDWIPGFAAPAWTPSKPIIRIIDDDRRSATWAWRIGWDSPCHGGSDFHGDDEPSRAGGPGPSARSRDRFDALESARRTR